jgi:DNA replication initiation complex subunit (GINS family)
MENEKTVDPYLLNIVITHEAAAMRFLGKVAGPDGKTEVNLEMARFAIDTIEALQQKTKGNLTDDEEHLFSHVLYQLRMNYIDEAEAEKKRAAQPAEKPAAEQKPAEPPEEKSEEQPAEKAEETPPDAN